MPLAALAATLGPFPRCCRSCTGRDHRCRSRPGSTHWDPAPLLPETASLSAEGKAEVDERQELDAASSPVNDELADDEPVASLKPDLEPSAPTEPLRQ